MDTRGQITKEGAFDQHGIILASGPEYMRSSSLNSIRLTTTTSSDHVVMYSKDSLNSGFLTFNPHDVNDDRVIKLCQAYGPLFEAHTLTKVNNKPNGDCDIVVGEDFYPALFRMLKDKRDWDHSLNCKGLATYDKRISEWTGKVLNVFGDKLHKVDIFGAVGVSRYSFDLCMWGPLSNTLHHAAGKMSISLYDLKIIGGLPILGKSYEEFIPQNHELTTEEHYPTTLAELLRIHSELCIYHKGNFVYQCQWVSHFYRGPSQRSRQELPLSILKEGALAAFLAFWLCRFVLPSKRSQIRPETFYMACLMAHGVKISLAPTVLGYIYHGLGQIAIEPRGPGKSGACLPVHYVIGWLGEYFLNLYTRFADNKFPDCYPRLARYAGMKGRLMNMNAARVVFKTHREVNYRPISFDAREDESFMDDGRLATCHFEMLISTHSALLPCSVRIGQCTWWYCRWWMKSYAPYLRLSVGNIFEVLNEDCNPTVNKKHDPVASKRKAVFAYFEEDKFYEARTRQFTPCHDEGSHTFTKKRKRSHEKDSQPLSPCTSQNINSKPSLEDRYQANAGTTTSHDSVSSKSLGNSPDRIILEQTHDIETSGPFSHEPTLGGKEFLLDTTTSSPSAHDTLVIMQKDPLPELVQDAPPTEPLLVSEGIRASVECIFGDVVLGFRKTFIASEIQNILHSLSFPKTSEELLAQRASVYDSLGNLRFFTGKYRAGIAEVEWLLQISDEIFRMADELSKLIVLPFDNDSAIIRDLTICHKECVFLQKTLDTQLVGLSQRLDDLDIEERDAIEAEERLRKLRKHQQAQRCFLNEQIGHLKKSLDEQREIEAKLHQARNDAEEERSRAFEQAKAHKMFQEEKLQELIGFVVSFCCKID